MKKKTLLSLVSLGAVALIGASVLVGCGEQNINTNTSSTVSNVVSNEIDVNTATGAKIFEASIAKFNDLTKYRANIAMSVSSQMQVDDSDIKIESINSYTADLANARNGAKPDADIYISSTQKIGDEFNQNDSEIVALNGGTEFYIGTVDENGIMSYIQSTEDMTGAYNMSTSFNINAFKEITDVFTNEGVADGKVKLVGEIGASDLSKINIGGNISAEVYADLVDLDALESKFKVEILVDSDTLLPSSILFDATDFVNEVTKVVDDGESTEIASNMAITSYYDYDVTEDFVITAPVEADVEIDETTETADTEESETDNAEETAE